MLLICQPAIYYGLFDFPGAVGRFPYSRLLQVSDYPPRGAYSPVDIQNAQASLVRFFQQNGYFEAQVEPEIQTDAAHGLVSVNFRVSLNRHAKFGNVILKGAPPEEEQRLQRALKSWMARVRGSAIRTGKSYSLRRVQNATQYLEVAVDQPRLSWKPGPNGGRRVRSYNPSRRCSIRGHAGGKSPRHCGRRSSLGTHRRKMLPIYQIAGLDPELIQESRENLISNFQAKGYFDVAVQSDVQPEQTAKQFCSALSKEHATK